MRRKCAFLFAALLATPAIAQDSVSTGGCLPGDAVSSYDDDSATNGSEQCNGYIVDLQEFGSRWGTRFGIAPLIKSSGGPLTDQNTNQVFNALLSAQAISRRHLADVSFPASSYDLWTSRGFGINNDATLNDPGTPTVPPAVGNQFAVVFADFATTNNSVDYNGIIGAFVNYDPSDPNRLYVDRRVVAINGCDDTASLAAFGIGAVDATGNVVFRADGGGSTVAMVEGCGLTSLDPNGLDDFDQNVYMVDMNLRDCASQNVVSDNYPGGLFDPSGATTEHLVRGSDVVQVVPNLIPAEVTGGAPVYFGPTFNAEYSRGASFPVTVDQSQLAGTGEDNSRGAMSYHSGNCAALDSSAGVVGQLLSPTDSLLVFGVDSSGTVTGNIVLTLPPAITDPDYGLCFTPPFFQTDIPCRIGVPGDCPGMDDECVGFSNEGLESQFDHYHGPTAFRGSVGQVAVGYDQAGRMIVAATAELTDCGNDCEENFVAVARIDCDAINPVPEWSVAGWSSVAGSSKGKAIVNGPSGDIVGQLVELEIVTGNVNQAPSISPPMIDSVGNIYFTSAIESYFTFTPMCTEDVDCVTAGCTGGETCVDGECMGCEVDGSDPDSALIRAVYDPDNFTYELDSLFDAGRPFTGPNSGLEYRITFMGTATGGSQVDPGTTFSQNISEVAFANQDPSGLDTASSDTLGGLVIRAAITYDSDDPPNGNISSCTGDVEPDPGDQPYQMMMYVSGVVPDVVPCTTIADCGDTDGDGKRDDPCLHYACVDDACIETARAGQSDMGGQFGACENDGSCDGNDRFLALGCFGSGGGANAWPADPCEVAPPDAINVDAGGQFGSCVLDGVCDGNDAFAALECFGSGGTGGNCSCLAGPQPQIEPIIEVIDTTGVSLKASARRARPGDLISVDVYFDDAVSDLRGYQLHLATSGGKRGQLELVDIAVENRKDAAMYADWEAFNMARGQMVAGMDSDGVATDAGAYLATFTYRVSRDAVGSFSIDLLHDNTDPAQRTFLFPTPSRAKIAVSGTTAARITVGPQRQARR